jgi:microcystin-dependent protein
MANPFLGQIALLPYNFAPLGWALCEGQLLPISQYTAVFSLLGTQFGGDGRTNFALPDLRGRAPIGQGQGPGLSVYNIGSAQGVEQVTLNTSTIPSHTHGFPAFATTATTNAPSGALPAEGKGAGRGTFAVNTYTAPGTAVSLAAAEVVPVTGGGAAHNNLQPYLTLNWCIALQGVFPSRS